MLNELNCKVLQLRFLINAGTNLLDNIENED